MSATCKEYRIALAAELDGETPGGSVARREAHAKRCSRCADEARRLMGLRRTLRAWPDVEAPPGLAERALERCAAISRSARPSVRWPVAAAIAAGCAAVLLWGVAALRPASEAPPSVSAEAAYALDALGRAGARIASARDRTQGILERVTNLEPLGRR